MASDSFGAGAGSGQHREQTAPLLITLDLHKHRDLCRCVLESAESFARHRERVTYLVPAGYVRLYDSLAGVLRQTRVMGHSIGCHGLNHTPDEDLGAMAPDREFALLREATRTLEDAIGEPVRCFRAPCYQISGHTLPILDELGYRADLSINPQHFPLFSSTPWGFGKLFAPRSPYHPGRQNPFRKGELKLLEIPTSCLALPFSQATILAVPRVAVRAMASVLASEAKRFQRAVVLQLHPESMVGKDDWKYPPICWKDFVPSRSGGFGFRYHLIERDPKKVQKLTVCILGWLRAETGLNAISVDDFLADAQAEEKPLRHNELCRVTE